MTRLHNAICSLTGRVIHLTSIREDGVRCCSPSVSQSAGFKSHHDSTAVTCITPLFWCYVEVRRGLRLGRAHVDRYVRADTLRDCERACDQAFFACKSFSFSSYRRRENENCLLSRDDSRSLDINDYRHFYKDQDFIFYERAYGRLCSSDIYNNLYMSSCYELKRTGERIDSRYIRRVLRTRDRRECEEECNRDALCKGFNYRFKTQGFNQYRDNCQLSHQDGGSHYDFHKDLDFDFYEKIRDSRNCYPSEPTDVEVNRNDTKGHGFWWNNYGGGGGGGFGGGSGGGVYGGGRNECFRLVEKERTISERDAAALFITRDLNECELSCEQSRQFLCKMFSFSYYSGRPGVRYNCLLSDIEFRELPAYSLLVDKDTDLYERRLYDRECGADYQGNVYPHGEGLTTVQGLRCYREPCRLDRQGGYYYCETDQSGAWDYCCRPQERCGYSEGYQLPWCYVGMVGRDQWRPCNEHGLARDYLKLGPPPDLVPDDDNITTTTADDYAPITADFPSGGAPAQPLELLDLF